MRQNRCRLLSRRHDTSKLGVAERVGFEPTVELPRQQFSRLPDSAALAPLRYGRSSAGLIIEQVRTTCSMVCRAYRGRCGFAMASPDSMRLGCKQKTRRVTRLKEGTRTRSILRSPPLALSRRRHQSCVRLFARHQGEFWCLDGEAQTIYNNPGPVLSTSRRCRDVWLRR